MQATIPGLLIISTLDYLVVVCFECSFPWYPNSWSFRCWDTLTSRPDASSFFLIANPDFLIDLLCFPRSVELSQTLTKWLVEAFNVRLVMPALWGGGITETTWLRDLFVFSSSTPCDLWFGVGPSWPVPAGEWLQLCGSVSGWWMARIHTSGAPPINVLEV